MTRVTRVAACGWPLMLLALLLATVALLARPAPTLAAEPEVRFTAEAADDGTWQLRATVTGADGSVLSQVPVTFVMATDFFGERWIPLGTSVTTTTGAASLTYVPTSGGDQQIVARAATSEGSRHSEPVFIHAERVIPAVPPEPPALPIIRAWALPVGISLVLLVWIVLGAIFVYAVLGIARQPKVVEAPGGMSPAVDGLETVESRVDGGSDS